MEWIVSHDEANSKLVTFLKNKLGDGYSAKKIKLSIEKNRARVNGRIEHFASAVLAKGDKVSFAVDEIINISKSAFNFDAKDILFEDESLLVYNKPFGIASDSKVLKNAIDKKAKGWELLHRLDKDTTGLLMFTKGVSFREKMVELFRKEKVEKVYLALVDGVVKQSKGVIDNYLAKVHAYNGQSLFASVTNPSSGLHAVTLWEVEKRGPHATLMRCYPKTGRTHQIRVHMSELKHPILGDAQYGKNIRLKISQSRCLLHAFRLQFIHPDKSILMQFEAPIPKDFQENIQKLIG